MNVSRETSMMDAQEFQAQTGVTDAQRHKLQTYVELLTKWQKRINIVGPKTIGDVWSRHMLDSWQVIHNLPTDTREIVDLGTGGGFPGMVLAQLGTWKIHLVDSDARKCSFLREVKRATAASVEIHNERIENLEIQADVVTSRACAPLTQLLAWSAALLKPGGICVLLKGRNWREELTEAEKEWKLEVSSVPSQTDPDSVILIVGGISRRHD